MQPTSVSGERALLSELFPIVGSHIKRLGLLRVAVGGLSMYLSIPAWVFCHLSLAVALYQWIVRPLFGLPAVRWRDHVVLDRHRVKGLSAFDVFNCWFCGYANGLCTMINTELDHLSRFEGRLPWWKTLLVTIAAGLNLPFIWFNDFFCVRFVYDVLISRPLGMQRLSQAEAAQILEREGYGAHFGPLGRGVLLTAKNVFLRVALALEQIESSWCPLRHFETRKGIVYPSHHKNFFGPDEVAQMRRVLSVAGTVSTRC
jgi:hypothetical protein